MKKLIVLLIVLLFLTSCAHGGANDSLFVVPDFSDTTWAEFVYEDTMKISWDKPTEMNNTYYVGYFTRLFNACEGDTLQYKPNFLEIFYLWYENTKWYVMTTIVLPTGRYMCNICAGNTFGISEISDACWIEFKMRELPLPKPEPIKHPHIKVLKKK